MRTIDSEADIEEGLTHLARRDRRLVRVIRVAGPVPLRRRPNGFAGLLRIVSAQQLSVASAAAIWSRFEAAFPDCRADAILAADDAALKATGMSAPKIRTLRAAAAAVRDGLDFEALAAMPAEAAHARLTAIPGIGPWTADVYLLFCLGHADVFPAGDLALRHAVAAAFGLAPPVPANELAVIAERWSPWRGVAACLFWTYFRAIKQMGALPV